MNTILHYLAGHPILAWSIVVAAGLVALLVTLYVLYLLYALWVYIRWRFKKDRSGARLVVEDLRVEHDEGADEIQLGWTLANHGKFPARRLHTSISLRVSRTDGMVASWRQAQGELVLAPGARIDIAIRVTRGELARLAADFKDGDLHLWSHYSLTPPKKAANFFGTYGPPARVKLAVGQVAGQDCVTVVDSTPIPNGGYLH